MFDTHCHLQFAAFAGREKEILNRAKDVGMTYMMLPSTDVATSQNAIQIVRRHSGANPAVASGEAIESNKTDPISRVRSFQDDIQLFAAVGIHPHHVFETQQSDSTRDLNKELKIIESLLKNKEVVAVGEIGVDRYYYKDTKYSDYRITEEFVALQKEVLKEQLGFVVKYDKSLILHNREAKQDLLEVLGELRVSELASLAGRTVLHCCEPDQELLAYAKEHGFYLGVDGDVTYSQEKAGFIKKVPLEMLVLETDSPFLTPEPIRSMSTCEVDNGLARQSKGRRPMNEPKNLRLIAEYIANLKNTSIIQIIEVTTANAKRLFRVQSS